MKKIKTFLLTIIIAIAFIIPFNKAKAMDSDYYSLYDDHLILNKYQGDLGTCWSFSLTRTLETTLAKHFNEAFVLSEGSLAARSSDVGAGEYLLKGIDMISQYSIAYEDDYSYQNLMYLKNDSSGSNYKQINSYLDSVVIKDLKMDRDLKLAPIVYSYKYDKDLIKAHLKDKGGLALSLNAYTYKENNLNGSLQTEIAKGRLATHALTVIGYDDTYKCLDGSVGAFILLNSNSFHEGRNILYLPYSYDISYYSDSSNVIGINILEEYLKDKLMLANDNEIENKASIGSSKSGFNAKGSKIIDKNVFYDKANLVYSLSEGKELNVDFVDIRFENKSVNDLFNIELGNDIKITSKDKLQCGTYKINIKYSYKDSNNNIVNVDSKREFYLIGGFMASFIKNEDDSLIDKFNTLTSNKTIVSFKKRKEGINTFNLYFRPFVYNEAKYYMIDNEIYEIKDNTIIIKEDYSSLYLDKEIIFLNSKQDIIDKYNLRLYFLDSSLDDYIYTNILYDNSTDIDSRLYNTAIFKRNDYDYKYYLPSLGFSYSYDLVDVNLESKPLKHDDLGYYLDLSLVEEGFINGGSYLLRRDPSLKERVGYSLYIKPKLNKKYELIDIPRPNEDLVYDGEVKNLFNDLDFKIEGSNISFIESGKYEARLEIIDKNKYRFSDGSTSIIIPWEIKRKVVDKPDINISKEYIYTGDTPFNLSLESYLSVGDIGLLPGDYSLEVSINNKNIVFSDGSNSFTIDYKILPADIKYKLDGNVIAFLGEYEGLMYSYDGVNYTLFSSDISLKPGRVYFKLMNYNDLVIDIVDNDAATNDNDASTDDNSFIMPAYGYALIALGIISVLSISIFLYKRRSKR